ncbi:ABC transporter permease [Enemella sp. A6]|uniref:ABC transporter permease n=1 Tax=Enemella sp. A6 TaxID=3440152 RepID=UPI003EBB32B2
MALRIATRIAAFVGSVLVASMLIFLVTAALPGDVAQVILGNNADPAAVEALRQRHGLDRPLPVQYFDWLFGMFVGDFGHSYLTGQSVISRISPAIGVTMSLVLGGMLFAIIFAIPMGMIAAIRRRHASGAVASALSQIGLAIPAFWAGLMLVYLFSVNLGWLPANGYIRFGNDPGRWARHLVLPVLSLAIVQGSVLSRYVRSAIIEVLGEDWIRTARSIGWTKWGALIRHGLRNASLSVVTVLGLQLATLFVGAIVVESVFTLPGLGSVLLSAVAQRDLMIVQGTVMLLVLAVLVINALVDLSYLALDPRLRSRR